MHKPQRKGERAAAFGLSADRQRALENTLQRKGIKAEDFQQWFQSELHTFFDRLVDKAAALPEQITIPLTLISQQQIGSLEAISQHLRDTRALQYTQVAALLNRDPRTIWASCRAADTATKGKSLSVRPEDFSVPLALFADRKLSILETAVVHLRETLGYKPYQIAEMLQRDQRVIATVWHRAMQKRKAAESRSSAEVGA